jgi:hypothetical protein
MVEAANTLMLVPSDSHHTAAGAGQQNREGLLRLLEQGREGPVEAGQPAVPGALQGEHDINSLRKLQDLNGLCRFPVPSRILFLTGITVLRIVARSPEVLGMQLVTLGTLHQNKVARYTWHWITPWFSLNIYAIGLPFSRGSGLSLPFQANCVKASLSGSSPSMSSSVASDGRLAPSTTRQSLVRRSTRAR